MGGKTSYPQTPELTIASDKFRLRPHMLEKMWRLFLENDKDRSGFIDVQEFHKMFKEGNSPFLRQLFRSNDINTDEQLTYPEFIELVGGFCLYDEKAMIQFAFSAFDKDGNGAIERDEFRLLIETLETNVAGEFPKQVEKALSLFDANRDGTISLDEFTEMNLRFPQLLWPAFRLQYRVQEATLGLTTWRKHQELLKTGDMVARRRKVCKFCICAGFELTSEEKRKLDEAKSREVPMDEANKDGKMKASVKRRKREERLRREGLPLDYREPTSRHSDEGKRLSRGKSGSDKSRKKKLGRKNSHRATKMGTKTKSSKGKKNGTLKKGKSSGAATGAAATTAVTKDGKTTGRTLARRHSSVGNNGSGNGGNGGNGSGDEKDSKKEAPKAGDAPRHRSLHSIRVMKRQQSQANSAAMSGSTDGSNGILAAGVQAHAELMAANGLAAAAMSGQQQPPHHHHHQPNSSAKYATPSAAHALPNGGSSSRGTPPPVIGDR